MVAIKEIISDPRLRFEKYFAECYSWVGSSTMTLEDGAPKFAKLLEELAPVAPTQELQSKLQTASKAIGAVAEHNNGLRLPHFFRSLELSLSCYEPSVKKAIIDHRRFLIHQISSKLLKICLLLQMQIDKHCVFRVAGVKSLPDKKTDTCF